MPPRSPTIVGSAVETMVWSSDASSSTSISAPKIRRTAGRCCRSASSRCVLAVAHRRRGVSTSSFASATGVRRCKQAGVPEGRARRRRRRRVGPRRRLVLPCSGRRAGQPQRACRWRSSSPRSVPSAPLTKSRSPATAGAANEKLGSRRAPEHPTCRRREGRRDAAVVGGIVREHVDAPAVRGDRAALGAVRRPGDALVPRQSGRQLRCQRRRRDTRSQAWKPSLPAATRTCPRITGALLKSKPWVSPG